MLSILGGERGQGREREKKGGGNKKGKRRIILRVILGLFSIHLAINETITTAS